MRHVRPVLLAFFLLALPVAPALSQSDPAEVSFWESVRDSKVTDELEAYLKAYPNGKFAPLARIRLNALRANDEAQSKDKAAPASSGAAKSVETQTASTPPVHDCDRLAAHPYDSERMSDGVKSDQIQVQEAVRACQRAVEAYPGTARFEFQLGRVLHRKESYGEAVTHFRNAAGKGHGGAMTRVGFMHAEGQGTAKDEAEAVRWYRRAADKGDAIGIYNLGRRYAWGQGVAKDEAEAVRLFRKAADKGVAIATYSLGIMYAEGRGVPKDEAEAVRWYRKAALKGSARAMNKLGSAYSEGQGVAKDEAEAVGWFRKAAEAGDPWGMQNLAVFVARGIGTTKDVAEANRWHRKAAEAGNMNAMTSLAINLESGVGITKDVAEANRWYGKGAEAGHRTAMTNLAINLERGNGITQDQAKAVEWYQKAAEKGEPYAFERLHALNTGVAEENSLSGDPPDKASMARMSREELERSFRLAALEANWQRAIPLTKELVAREEIKHRMAHFLLGLDQFKSRSYAKAKDNFKVASQGPIGELMSTLTLAWTEVAQGNAKKALKLLNTPKQPEWKQSFLNYHRALIADLAGRQKEADAAFKLGYQNENRTLRNALAYARHEAHYGKTERAKDILQERIERIHDLPPPTARDLLAKIKAGETISLLVKTPEDGMAEVFYGLGNALVGEGGVTMGTLYLQMARYLQPHHAFARATIAVAKPQSALDRVAKDLEKLD